MLNILFEKIKQIISISFDVKSLDKSKFVNHKNGKTYCNLTVFLNHTPDQYGNDCSVAQGQTKEERERKEKHNFVGNGKVVWTDPEFQSAVPQDSNIAPIDNSQPLPF